MLHLQPRRIGSPGTGGPLPIPGRLTGYLTDRLAYGRTLAMLTLTLLAMVLAKPAPAEPIADAFSAGVTQTAAMPGALVRALDWRFGDHADRTRFVLELSDAVPYRIFVLGSPYRVVVDLPRLDWTALPPTNPGRGLVTGIRQGWLDAQTLRLVLDVARPVRVVGHELLTARDGHQPRLMIDIGSVPPAEFQRTLSTIFGRLGRTQGPTPAAVASAVPAVPAPVPVPAPGRPAAQAAAPRAPATAALQTHQPPVPATTPQRATAIPASLPTAPPMRSPATPPKPPSPSGQRPLIMLDPGHGGIDPGAIGVGGLREKDVTLAIARALRQELERTGRYRVALTRTNDTFVRLRQRVAIARDRKADLFISLHADSLNSATFRGMSVYTLSDTASDREAEQIAANENRADAIGGIDLSQETDVVASILIDLAQRDTLNHSRRLARHVVDSLKTTVPMVPKPQRSAGFAVLTAADVPSVLIELGYLTNAADAHLLTAPDERRTVAKSLLRAIEHYFEWVTATDNS